MRNKRAQANWYDHRAAAFAFGLAGLALAFVLAVRAEDTGSLQQYFLTFVLIVFGANRLVRVVRGKAHA